MPIRVRRALPACAVFLGALVISCGSLPVHESSLAAPQGRPGGAPPGAELVEVPGGSGSALAGWLSAMDHNCEAANYGKNCLSLYINYTTKWTRKNCTVEHQNPGMGTRVKPSTPVTLDVTCDPPADPMKPDGSSSAGTGKNKGYPGT